MTIESTTKTVVAGPTHIRTVHLERLDDGAIAVLTLDDPERANAMSPEMGDVFTKHIRSIQDDASLKAVVIRGAGKDFSIGDGASAMFGGLVLGNRKASNGK